MFSQKAYAQTESGKKIRKVARAKYRRNHPKETRAKWAVDRASRGGKIRRSVFCEFCGLPAKTEAHHTDYNKLLKVDWLCDTCHKITHKSLRQVP